MWKLTITVPSGKLEKVMTALQMKEVTLRNEDMVYIPDSFGNKAPNVTKLQAKRRSKHKIKADDALTMNTDKRPAENTIMHRGMLEFEKLEAKAGIGNVTRGRFKDHLCTRQPQFSNDPPSTVAQLLKCGYLLSLDPGGIDAATYGR